MFRKFQRLKAFSLSIFSYSFKLMMFQKKICAYFLDYKDLTQHFTWIFYFGENVLKVFPTKLLKSHLYRK